MTREEVVNSMSLQDAIQVLKDTNCYGTMDIAKTVILKALEQEPCENPHIYECSCGYGWDKSKVVRHHFCPNCGAKVTEGSKK